MRCRIPLHPLRQNPNQKKLGHINVEPFLHERLRDRIVRLSRDDMSILMAFQDAHGRVLLYDLSYSYV